MKKISVVVPCFNEEENIFDSYNLLKTIFENLKEYDYEFIFADNDSTDRSEKILRDIASQDSKFKVILNNRNFGAECNTINAFYSATGDAVIVVLCDRQDPYELIPEFIKRWEEGNKVVWGQKIASKENWLMFKMRSLYYNIIESLSSKPFYKQVIGYGLYDREVVEEVRNIKHPNPFLRFIVADLGYKPFLIPYVQETRKKGKTSYNFFSYVDAAMSALIQTSKVPMKFMIHLGSFFSFLSFLVGVLYLTYKLIFWDSFSTGIAPLFILVAFFASLQILFLGIIGEYLLAVLDRVSFYKNVIEKERINF